MHAITMRNLAILLIAGGMAVLAMAFLASLAEAQSNPNAFNRLMKPASERNAPPPSDGIHDPDERESARQTMEQQLALVAIRADGSHTPHPVAPETLRFDLPAAAGWKLEVVWDEGRFGSKKKPLSWNLAINGIPIDSWRQMQSIISSSGGAELTLSIRRAAMLARWL